MGFESFRVELGGARASYSETDLILRKLPYIRPDRDSISLPDSTYYVWDDGRHKIEIELVDDPVGVSCRFTLCHPVSVDEVFLSLVRELMVRLGMTATICDNVRPEHAADFPLARFAEFAAAASAYIAIRRAEWIKAFGVEQMAATTTEVCEQIIIPRCEPVAAECNGLPCGHTVAASR